MLYAEVGAVIGAEGNGVIILPQLVLGCGLGEAAGAFEGGGHDCTEEFTRFLEVGKLSAMSVAAGLNDVDLLSHASRYALARNLSSAILFRVSRTRRALHDQPARAEKVSMDRRRYQSASVSAAASRRRW